MDEKQAAGCLLKSKQHGLPITSIAFQVNNSHPVLRSNLSPWAGASMMQRQNPVCSSRSRSSSTNHTSNPLQMYQQLYEVFGDSLGPRIAHNNWQDAVVTKSNLMRIQPFTHAYFPLRPLQRDANAIRERICKAKERIQAAGTLTGSSRIKRRRTEAEEAAHGDNQSIDASRKTVCFAFKAKTKSLAMSMDLDAASLPRRKHSQTETGTLLPKKVIKTAIVTGRIRRRYRKRNPSLNNKSKYDFHLGVFL